MEAKFFKDAVFKGKTANAVKLGTILALGRFWMRPAGCHTVYRGQDGNIDYDNIQAVMELDDNQVSIANQDLPAETRWRYIRRQVSDCGLESPDSPACVVVIDSAGNMRGKTPNPPLNITIENLSNARFKLRWRYIRLSQEASPTGFRIYMDSGSGFDFNTPLATVENRLGGPGEFNWTSEPLTDGQLCKFVVRSYTTDTESQNTNFVAAIADSQGPDAITGLRADWEQM